MVNITLQQKSTLPTKQNIDAVSHWLMIFADPMESCMHNKPIPYQTQLLKRRQQFTLKKAGHIPIAIDLPNKKMSHVAFAVIEVSISSFGLLTLARKLVARHSENNPSQFGLLVAGFTELESTRIAEALIAAVLAATATMPRFKSDRQTPAKLNRLFLYGVFADHGFKKSFAIAKGNA